MGEDPSSRGRDVHLHDGRLSEQGVQAFFRGVWKFVFVLVVTIAVLFAIGWVIQAVTDAPRDVTTPVEQP